jgi:chromosome partitioning protein
MKGGVGKSTTVACLAEALAADAGLRVLVVDLDPQSNVSMMLAGLDRWGELRTARQTIDQYYEQHIRPGTEPRFFRDLIARNVSDIAGGPKLDLMISTPEFRNIERDALAKWVRDGFDIEGLKRKLCNLTRAAVDSVSDSYDLALFDCPPGISLFAEAAIEMSEFVLIPTIPDYVSRLGIFAFRKRALRAMEQRRFGEDNIWTLITKFEPVNALHQSEAILLKDQFNVFETMIPQSEDIARAAVWAEGAQRTLDQKYGKSVEIVRRLAGEFRERAGLV